MIEETLKFDDLKSDRPDGLIPAIVQDAETLSVLMMGYMDREAFDATLSTKKVTFFSRSRKKLWTKGETSGNFLHLHSIAADCDNDTLLVRAAPEGPSCHNGTRTCFGPDTPDTEGFIRKLAKVIAQRHTEMPEGHYTTFLFTKGIEKMAQKVGEEAVETVIEAVRGDSQKLTAEACDLIYHLLVLLEAKNITIADLETELMKRHR